MNINKTRGILYTIARILGDITAVTSKKPGKTTKRVVRRITGKATGRVFRRVIK